MNGISLASEIVKTPNLRILEGRLVSTKERGVVNGSHVVNRWMVTNESEGRAIYFVAKTQKKTAQILWFKSTFMFNTNQTSDSLTPTKPVLLTE